MGAAVFATLVALGSVWWLRHLDIATSERAALLHQADTALAKLPEVTRYKGHYYVKIQGNSEVTLEDDDGTAAQWARITR